jgi:iron-sulfur cluster assembly protein
MEIVEKPEILEQIILTISPAALAAVKQLLQEHKVPDYALRLSAISVGCSSVQFGLAFEPEAQENDRVLELEGVRLLLDSASLPRLNGLSIDYVESLTGSGFQLTQPNADSGCGCGSASQTVAQDNQNVGSSCCN